MVLKQLEYIIIFPQKETSPNIEGLLVFGRLVSILSTLDLIMILMIVGHTFTDYLYGIKIYQPDYIIANWADVIGWMVNHCAVCQRGTSCLGEFTFFRH